jgi:hypothetical protein
VSMKQKTVTRSKAVSTRKTAPAKKKAAPQVSKATSRAAHKAAKTVIEKKLKAMALPKPAAPKLADVSTPRPAIAHPRTRPAAKHAPHVTRVATASAAAAQHRQVLRLARASQFNFMRAPGISDAFDVGDTVEVFCDHERNGERVRGWIKGIVVQVDNKLVAVQFRSNVFLTDGWMVPDRILWYSLTSDQIRPATFAKRGSQKAIPDY